MASTHNDDHKEAIHSLTAYCIAIRAANGAALQPIYSRRLIRDKSVPNECHLKESLVHDHGTSDSLMIGGGAWVTGEMNFLSWSLPVLESNGRGLWKAYSADRAAKPDDQKMQIVTIGLKDVQTSLQAGPLPHEFRNFTFNDTFEGWHNDGGKFEKRG